ncbi:MAG: hypothetical protein KA165_17835 [Saprospiraceae bacterium]|nr:hypothetical protein [Saprospiraceae bacterium]
MDLIPLILFAAGAIHLIRKSLETDKRLPAWDKVLANVWIASIAFFALTRIPGLGFIEHLYGEMIYVILLLTVWFLRDYRPANLLSLALLPYAAVYVVDQVVQFIAPSFYESNDGLFDTARTFAVLWLFGFGIYASVQNNKERKIRTKQEAEIRQAEARKAELEHLVVERTAELTTQKEELEKTLTELKAAQDQLVHSEKMASLGELTAGIAHEIQNPLNFVNNFSELSVELAQELTDEMEKPEPDKDLVRDLVRDLAQNQEKINHHGKRAANIVTGMLQHARTSTGAKEPTDLNALADEYLRLSYHGLRAKDKSFNAKMVTHLDTSIGKVDVVPQDLGRVLLNLINNAFYAVTERKKQQSAGYEPTVTVSTRLLNAKTVEIRIQDNGTGIPDSVKAKIFQPFFTTKPTGQGTGLGLSLAYDIVTKGHGGSLELKSKEGAGTEFVLSLPLKN